MRPSTKAGLLLGSALSLIAGTASAQVCVVLDAQRDTLPEADRSATRMLLIQTLARNGQQVVDSGCAGGTYTVYHVKLGNSVTIFLHGPNNGYRESKTKSIEEIPEHYSQMVRSMLNGQPMTGINETVDRNTVTNAQAAPKRVQADSLWYLRIGYASILGLGFNAGPAFGLGYRYELDTVGIDLSFLNFAFASNENQSADAGFNGSLAKLVAYWFADPSANRTAYLGGGVSWGFSYVSDANRAYGDTGLQGEISAGFELLRATSIRMFAQLDATLPFYSSDEVLYTGGPGGGGSRYTPSIILSVGAGFGRSNTIGVVVH